MKKLLMQLSCQLCHLPGSLHFFFFLYSLQIKRKPNVWVAVGVIFFFLPRTGNAKIRGRNSEGEVRRERESQLS